MKSIKSLDADLKDKVIILRLDLNVPLAKGKIIDTNRIDKIIPTIKFLRNKNAKLIIISHIGRPKGKVDNNLSLKYLIKNLSEQTNETVRLMNKNIYSYSKKNIFESINEKILLLENIRFYPEEEENDVAFAKHLASIGDIYVNEAFSCSHRSHASICKIAEFLTSYSGLQMDHEISVLNKITNNITKPATCIIGGSKISTKINIIENLITKLDNLIIVGGMANNFLKSKEYKIGKSIFEKNAEQVVQNILKKLKSENCNLIIPEDVSVGKSLNGNAINKNVIDMNEDDIILDVGIKTIEKIKSTINNSKTILWNGPLGYFENDEFAKGSNEIAKYISKKSEEKKIFSVIGGGDTVSVITKLNLNNKFNFVSTAGGAFLEYLEGKELPGIKALN